MSASSNIGILAIDIGTSSVRSAVYTQEGQVLADSFARRTYAVRTDSTGRATLDPAELQSSAAACVEETLGAKTGMEYSIASIGTSCFWHSLLGVSGNDGIGYSPASDILTWADSRCRQSAASLRESLSEREFHARTGCMLRSSFWPAKLHWLAQAFPNLAPDLWIGPGEWVLHKLFGRPLQMGVSSASGTGLLSGGEWDDELLAVVGTTKRHLPVLNESAFPAVSRWNRINGADVLPPLGDGSSSNLGSGAHLPPAVALNFGTSAAVRTVASPETRAPFGLFKYSLDESRRLIGGAISNAGSLHDWCSRTLRIPQDSAELEALMSQRTYPIGNLTVLPFLMAERAPTWPEEIPAVLAGMSPSTSALDIYQAFLEATFQRLAQILDVLPGDDGTGKRRIIVSGGLSRSPSAMQRLANVMGETTEACSEPEASLRGAAIRAVEHLGKTAAPLEPGASYPPDPEKASRYLELRRRQVALENLFS